MESIDRHQEEILSNQQRWNEKPILRKIYKGFHKRISDNLPLHLEGSIVELGSGIADISETIPNCLRTDLFPNPWIDQVENAYRLSFPDRSVSAIILFDVFHHLRYPGRALQEFNRVLMDEGHLIIFDPGISLLGRLVYGPFHPEPLALKEPLTWSAPEGWSPDDLDYYAAQGNAHRVFLRGEFTYPGWEKLQAKRYAEVSYVASGGYSKPQMYPDFLFPLVKRIDKVLDLFPMLFGTRLLVVLKKTSTP